jgi:hypothetical protein
MVKVKNGIKRDSDKGDINHVIKEKYVISKSINLETEIGDKKIDMLIDTGSSRNYISKDWVERLEMKTKDNILITTGFGNNEIEESRKSVLQEVYIPMIGKKRWVEFYVLDKCKGMITLSNEFLCENEVIID